MLYRFLVPVHQDLHLGKEIFLILDMGQCHGLQHVYMS